MARKDSEHQKKSMSRLFRGKAIFKPLNTGWIDEHVACVREWVANIFFYTKNGVTIMIDAGYNYECLKEKMGWLDIDPASIRQVFITHQDTDHVGALERDSELLFRDAAVYIGEIENRYLTGEVRRKVLHGAYKLPMVKTDNRRVLLKDGEVITIGDIRIECILCPGHTWGHMVYLIDDEYLFTGDTIWFGADGGYSFLSTLAEDNRLAVLSLEALEKNLRARQQPIRIITGHTGWTDDLDFAFRHRTEICKPFTKKYTDPSAPYDGYVEDDDTEESARSVPLRKVGDGMKPDYKNRMPKGIQTAANDRPERFHGAHRLPDRRSNMKTAEKIMKKKAVIKAEMDKSLPKDKSDALWREATAKLSGFLTRYSSLPKGVHMHTDSRILPSAAIYLTVKDVIGQEKAYRIIEDAAVQICRPIEKKLRKLMSLPGMQSLFLKAWDPMTKKLFGPGNGFRNVFYPKKKGEYRMDVTSCPYCRYFTALGCPELTKIFCENDERIYGNLPGLKFERTGTLGKGAERCDFCLRKA